MLISEYEKKIRDLESYRRDKIRLVVDLYDQANYAGSANYYDGKRNPLTAKNKLGPPAT